MYSIFNFGTKLIPDLEFLGMEQVMIADFGLFIWTLLIDVYPWLSSSA
jgi:hypothetical protein